MENRITLAFFCLLILSSCGSYKRIGDISIISTRNIDSKMEYVELRRYVKAVGKPDNNNTKALELAVESAIKQVPGGELLKNCIISSNGETIKVEGDVWGVAGKDTQLSDKDYEKIQKKKQKEAYKKAKNELK